MASKSRESNKLGTLLVDADDPAYTTSFGGAARYVRAAWGMPDVLPSAPAAKKPMSRRIAVALAALGVAVVAGAGTLAYHFAYVVPTGVALDATTFPDAALRAALVSCDEDGNGRISAEEASHVTSLDLSNQGIVDLAGIDTLTHLESLNVSGNDLATIDLTKCRKLVTLDVSDNLISDLDLDGLANLEELDAHNNGLQTLQLEGCAALRVLDVEGNGLARLDLSGCPAMERLNMDEGQEVTLPLASTFFPDEGLRITLEPFDTDKDGALSQRERQAVYNLAVDVSTTNLEGLEWFANLQDLTVSGAQLGSIEAGVLPPSLTSLHASGCALESIDLSSTGRLMTLDLSNNSLGTFDVSSLARLTNANFANCNLAGEFNVTANTRLEHIDVSGNPALVTLNALGVPGLAIEGAVTADATCTVVSNATPAADESDEGADEGQDAPEDEEEPQA